jgi:hypothetical protein
MTALELLGYECDQTRDQIHRCLEGMDEKAMDTPCTEGGMTPREMLEHMCEAYQALITTQAGGKHDWGSYSIADKSTANIRKTFDDLRAKAVETVLADGSDDQMKHGYDFIVGHDNYHVAQLVHSRLKAQPDWNSYAIYG